MNILNRYAKGLNAIKHDVFKTLNEGDHARKCFALKTGEGFDALKAVMLIREQRIHDELCNPMLPEKTVDFLRGMMAEHRELTAQLVAAADWHQTHQAK